MGAGIVGASCARELADRGAPVLLVERGELSGGTTGLGEGNVLVSDKPPGPELELARAGRAVWDALAERYPDAVRMRRKGALVLFEDDGAAAFAAALGGDAEVVEDPRAEEPALADGLPPAVLVRGDSQVDPRGTARALAEGLAVRQAEVTRVEAGGVELAGGERLAAEAVAVCAGPWAGGLLPELAVQPRKGQLVALGPAPGLIRRKCFEASYVAATGDAGGVASVVEEALSGEVYVGSSREFAGFDMSPRADVSDALVARAAHWFPALAALPRTRAWAGLRPYRAAGIFAGRLESGVWACAGHEGAGVGVGPVTAQRLAQAMLATRAS